MTLFFPDTNFLAFSKTAIMDATTVDPKFSFEDTIARRQVIQVTDRSVKFTYFTFDGSFDLFAPEISGYVVYQGKVILLLGRHFYF